MIALSDAASAVWNGVKLKKTPLSAIQAMLSQLNVASLLKSGVSFIFSPFWLTRAEFHFCNLASTYSTSVSLKSNRFSVLERRCLTQAPLQCLGAVLSRFITALNCASDVATRSALLDGGGGGRSVLDGGPGDSPGYGEHEK